MYRCLAEGKVLRVPNFGQEAEVSQWVEVPEHIQHAARVNLYVIDRDVTRNEHVNIDTLPLVA